MNKANIRIYCLRSTLCDLKYNPTPLLYISYYPPLYEHSPSISKRLVSSAWLCQQSSWYGSFSVVGRPSVVRPCLNLMTLSNFGSCFAWAIRSDFFFFWIFEKKKAFSNFTGFFSSAWLCQQSSWNRNLSVVCRPSHVRPSVSQLSI